MDAELLKLIGLVPEDFQYVQRAGTVAEAEGRLADLKKRAKQGYKKQVLKLHPDLTGGDEAKATVLMGLNELMGAIEKLRPVRRVPQPRPRPRGVATRWPDGWTVYVNGVRET